MAPSWTSRREAQRKGEERGPGRRCDSILPRAGNTRQWSNSPGSDSCLLFVPRWVITGRLQNS